MKVQIELTQRLAELLGYRERTLQLPDTATLEAALSEIEREVPSAAQDTVLRDGRLHPAILVVVEGEASSSREPRPLTDGALVQLMLPVAGG